MEKETWIVVANGSSARILLSKEGKGLHELKTLHHPDERWQAKMAAHAGPTPVNVVGQGHHPMDAHASAKQKSHSAFAKVLATHLHEAYHAGSFQRLYLVASPAFLGELRQALTGPVAAILGGAVDKDLTAVEPQEVRSYLPPVL